MIPHDAGICFILYEIVRYKIEEVRSMGICVEKYLHTPSNAL